MPDREAFWSAIQTLASTFREEDPRLTGKLYEMVAHFDGLPEEQQIQLRHDVQLLMVQFSKLALAMNDKFGAH